MIISDAPSCGVTYNHHSDDSRRYIYDYNIIIRQALLLDQSKLKCLSVYIFHYSPTF
jgi:hypothetical protein